MGGAASENSDVTVVIACFNYGAWLTEAIASTREQAGGPPRMVVVDDGSTDETTVRVLAELERDPRLDLVRQENGGAAAARNAGLARAQTPYVLSLDADDKLPPRALTDLKQALSRAPDAGFAYGRTEFFGEWSGTLHLPDYDPWRLLFRHIIGPTALMRQELIQATGGYDPSFGNFEDWELWVHALVHGFKGVKVDAPGLHQRKHGASKLTRDRGYYHDTFRRLRAKHSVLYDDLRQVRRQSALGPVQRALYRYLWGPRPWPPKAEVALHSLLWRAPRDSGAIATSTTTR